MTRSTTRAFEKLKTKQLSTTDKVAQLPKPLRKQVERFKGLDVDRADLAWSMRNNKDWWPVFDTWKQFCEQALGISKRQGNRLVAHAETIELCFSIKEEDGQEDGGFLGPMVPNLTQLTEGQTRGISELDDTKKVDVLTQAVEIAEEREKPLTARIIKEAKKAVCGVTDAKPRTANENTTETIGTVDIDINIDTDKSNESPAIRLATLTTTLKATIAEIKDICLAGGFGAQLDAIGAIHLKAYRLLCPIGKFVKPTLEEVKDLAAGRSYSSMDTDGFWNFYESNGWRVGKNPMKSWQAAMANWNSRDNGKSVDNDPIKFVN